MSTRIPIKEESSTTHYVVLFGDTDNATVVRLYWQPF